MLSLLKHVPPSLVAVNLSSVLLPRNVIDGLQPLKSNKYQVEFDPGGRELASTCEKIKVLHKIIINLH